MPSGCADHVGSVTLSLQVTDEPLVVAACVVARFATPTCQAEPVQYWPSGRCSGKVTVLAVSPDPLLLSAALPVKGLGTLEAPEVFPSAGGLTHALPGA